MEISTNLTEALVMDAYAKVTDDDFSSVISAYVAANTENENMAYDIINAVTRIKDFDINKANKMLAYIDTKYPAYEKQTQLVELDFACRYQRNRTDLASAIDAYIQKYGESKNIYAIKLNYIMSGVVDIAELRAVLGKIKGLGA